MVLYVILYLSIAVTCGLTAFSVLGRINDEQAHLTFSMKMQPTKSSIGKNSMSLRSTLTHTQELIFFVPEDTATNYISLSLCEWVENESM